MGHDITNEKTEGREEVTSHEYACSERTNFRSPGFWSRACSQPSSELGLWPSVIFLGLQREECRAQCSALL